MRGGEHMPSTRFCKDPGGESKGAATPAVVLSGNGPSAAFIFPSRTLFRIQRLPSARQTGI